MRGSAPAPGWVVLRLIFLLGPCPVLPWYSNLRLPVCLSACLPVYLSICLTPGVFGVLRLAGMDSGGGAKMAVIGSSADWGDGCLESVASGVGIGFPWPALTLTSLASGQTRTPAGPEGPSLSHLVYLTFYLFIHWWRQ